MRSASGKIKANSGAGADAPDDTDSRKAPEGISGIEIKVSGLAHLRYFSVYDRAAGLKRLEVTGNQKLKSLDLSKAKHLSELICDRKLKVKGYKGEITRV